jgi:hypothetical protein
MLEGFYYFFQASVRWCRKFYADSRWPPPNDLTGHLERFTQIRVRKRQGNVFSHREGLRGFDKHSASTYVADAILKNMVLCSIIDRNRVWFPWVFSSVGFPQILQRRQKSSLLVLRSASDILSNMLKKSIQLSSNARFVTLLAGIRHEARPPGNEEVQRALHNALNLLEYPSGRIERSAQVGPPTADLRPLGQVLAPGLLLTA